MQLGINVVVKGGHALLVYKRTIGGQWVGRVAKLLKEISRLAQCFAIFLEDKGCCRHDEGPVAGMSRRARGVRETPLRPDKRKARQTSHLVVGRAGFQISKDSISWSAQCKERRLRSEAGDKFLFENRGKFWDQCMVYGRGGGRANVCGLEQGLGKITRYSEMGKA